MNRTARLRGALCPFLLAVALLAAGCGTGEGGRVVRPGSSSFPQASGSAHAPLVYVGTSSGDSTKGIYTLRFDPGGKGLTRLGEVEPILNPSFLARSPSARFLYAVSEAPGEEGHVSAYRVDAGTGALTFLNEQPTGGSGPAYVSTDRTGRWVLAANYGSGSVALLPTGEDGRLGNAADVVQHEGSGPNAERQQGPHAHYVHVGPDNRYVYATDLGADQLNVYALDADEGRLTAAPSPDVPAGSGPRHLAFYPGGRWVYLVSELSGTVTVYARDAANGALSALQTLSAVPDGFDGYNKSADLHVHPSGRWLYVSNRGDAGGIAVFAIDAATGRLTPAGYQRQHIDWPRNFAIAPSGQYLLVANRHADEVVAFSIDQATGQLTFTGYHAEVPEPTNVTFVEAGE